MGVLPLQFLEGDSVVSLGLSGHETLSVEGLAGLDEHGWPREVTVRVENADGARAFRVQVRLDTATEAKYFRHGGVLPFVARSLVAGSAQPSSGG
jgi:aconitate hydratase